MESKKNIQRFHVIEGGQSPRPDTRITETEERVTCHVCENHEGVDTVELLPVSTFVVREANGLKTVRTQMLCLCCLLRGRKTYLT